MSKESNSGISTTAGAIAAPQQYRIKQYLDSDECECSQTRFVADVRTIDLYQKTIEVAKPNTA